MNDAALDGRCFKSAAASIFQRAPIKFDIPYEAALGSQWCVFMNMYSFDCVNYALDKRPWYAFHELKCSQTNSN